MPLCNRMIMKSSILINSLLIAAALPLLPGCVIFERQPVAVAPPPGEMVVTRPEAPPPPKVEVLTVAPGPLDLWVWVPGCYEWRGHWVWVAGRWAPLPRPHAVWMTGHWARQGDGYVWIAGRWR